MSLGPIDSAIRVAAFWSISTAIVVWFSADFATRKPSEINPILGILVAFAAKVSMLSALLAPYPLFLTLYPDRRASIVVKVAILAAGFACLWINSIILQLLQNVGYRVVGANERPVRWYRGYKPMRRHRGR